MGLKTDFMSLGAIGLGTAVAVVGTGGLLVAGAVHELKDNVTVDVEDGRCVAVSISTVSSATDAKVAKIAIIDGDVNVDVSDLHELGEAPLDVDVDVACATDIERRIEADMELIAGQGAKLEMELRQMAEELRVEAQARAGEARQDAMQAHEEALREAAAAVREARERGNDRY